MGTKRITTIGRPLVFSDPGNISIIAIILLTFFVSVITHLLRGEMSYSILFTSARTATLIFLLWAVSREIDPDNRWSAFLPLFPGYILITWSGNVPLMPFVWLLVVLRIIGRSTGLPAGIMDSLFLAITGMILAYNNSPIYGIITSAAFIADSRLREPLRYHLGAGIAFLFISVLIRSQAEGTFPSTSASNILLVVSGSILVLPILINNRKIKSTGDRTGETLDPARTGAARILSMAMFASLAITHNNINHITLQLIFSIFAGVGLYSIISGLHVYMGNSKNKPEIR